jgi:Na+/proline symporter
LKYLVIAGYFAVLLAIGAVASRRVRGISDFYVGGKHLGYLGRAGDLGHT